MGHYDPEDIDFRKFGGAVENEDAVLAEHQKRYVMGLSFSEDLSRVVLVKKDRPGLVWHNFLMGLGGRVEIYDYQTVSPPTQDADTLNKVASINAMVREFEEEAGVRVPPSEWHWYCSLQGWNKGPDREGDFNFPFRVDCFWNVGPAWRVVRTAEKELVKSYQVQYLNIENDQPKLFPNVTWLLPMALTLASGAEKRAKAFGDIKERS